MKEYAIFMDLKNKQLKDVSYFKNDTQFSANLIQILKLFCGTWQAISKKYKEDLRS